MIISCYDEDRCFLLVHGRFWVHFFNENSIEYLIHKTQKNLSLKAY